MHRPYSISYYAHINVKAYYAHYPCCRSHLSTLRSTQHQIPSNDILLNQKQTALPSFYTTSLAHGPLVSLGSP